MRINEEKHDARSSDDKSTVESEGARSLTWNMIAGLSYAAEILHKKADELEDREAAAIHLLCSDTESYAKRFGRSIPAPDNPAAGKPPSLRQDIKLAKEAAESAKRRRAK